MRRWIKKTAGLAMAVMMMAVTGCGVSSNTTKEEVTEMATEEKPAEAEEQDVLNVNVDNMLLYCITPSTANPFFEAIQKACKEEGEALGYTVKCESHDEDASRQAELFDEAIAEGATAIICDNADPDATIEPVERAKEAGIPTFLVDREINREGLCISQIVTDNYQGATAVAQYLVEVTGGEGRYIELLGPENDKNCRIRSEAFHAILDRTNMEMAAQRSAKWDREEGRIKTAKLLLRYPDITAVVCGNDAMACGAADAVAEANPDHEIFIIGMDGSDEMADNITEGRATATVLQQIDAMTRNAVNQANDYLMKGRTGVEEKQWMDCVLVNKDNADRIEGFVNRGK